MNIFKVSSFFKVSGFLFHACILVVVAFSVSSCGGTYEGRKIDKLAIFSKSYGAYIRKREKNTLFMKDGTTITIDTHKKTSFQEKLENPDIRDMFLQDYPLQAPIVPPAKNQGPGRVNNQDFLKAVYGGSAQAVKRNSLPMDWFGTTVLFNTRNGAYTALQKVKENLQKLPKKYRKYLENPGGTFKYRVIAGTKRLSLHSFAIAIDINTKYANYWRWTLKKLGKKVSSDVSIAYENRIPKEIVDIFEAQGFVWGGRWYHYDTMHFSYRPDLIAIARAKMARP